MSLSRALVNYIGLPKSVTNINSASTNIINANRRVAGFEEVCGEQLSAKIEGSNPHILCRLDFRRSLMSGPPSPRRRYLVRCSANAIAFNIAQLLCYCEKDNLCSLLDSGRKIFYWSKLTMLRSTSPAVSSGEECGLLSRTAAGNRAYILCRWMKMLLYLPLSLNNSV